MSSSNGSRIDLHVKVLDAAVVNRAKARGLDGIVYAPHFVQLPDITARAERYADEDLVIVPGREIFTGTWRNRKHLLVVDPADPVPDFITLEGAMNHLAGGEAPILVPHPEFMTVSLTESDIRRYRDRIDGIETYNPKHFRRHNRRARSIQAATGLPAFASSYAHLPGTVGEVWTEFPQLESSVDSVVSALTAGRDMSIGRRSGVGHQVRRVGEIVHLGYENSVEKAYQFSQGHKPTNPYHPRYGGRFDDCAVYGPPRIRGYQSE